MEGRILNVSLAYTKEEYAITKEKENKEKEEDKKVKRKEKLERVKNNYEKSFDSTKTLFVNNLSFNTDESSLREFFETYGEVIYVKIVKNKETQTSKGSGFVMMNSSKDADNIIKNFNRSKEKEMLTKSTNSLMDDVNLNLNEFELDGRNINILSAVSKEDAMNMKTLEESTHKIDKTRNNHLLYYGIGNNSLSKLENVNNKVVN